MQLGRDTGRDLACPWPLGTLPGPSSCHGPKPLFQDHTMLSGPYAMCQDGGAGL